MLALIGATSGIPPCIRPVVEMLLAYTWYTTTTFFRKKEGLRDVQLALTHIGTLQLGP
jgi:hypothetical protein